MLTTPIPGKFLEPCCENDANTCSSAILQQQDSIIMILLFRSRFKTNHPPDPLALNFFASRESTLQCGWRASYGRTGGRRPGRHEGTEEAPALIQVLGHAISMKPLPGVVIILGGTDSKSMQRLSIIRAPRISRNYLGPLGWRMRWTHSWHHHRLPPGSVGSGCLWSFPRKRSRIRHSV